MEIFELVKCGKKAVEGIRKRISEMADSEKNKRKPVFWLPGD